MFSQRFKVKIYRKSRCRVERVGCGEIKVDSCVHVRFSKQVKFEGVWCVARMKGYLSVEWRVGNW